MVQYNDMVQALKDVPAMNNAYAETTWVQYGL